MFDIIDFVNQSGLIITFAGLDDPVLIGVAVSDYDSGIMVNDVFMVRQPDESDSDYESRLKAFVEKQAAKIGKEKAGQISAKQVSRQLAERERFFREGKGWSDDN